MSQFILCKGKSTLICSDKIDKLQIKNDVFLAEASKVIFPNVNDEDVWSVSFENIDFDSLCVKAQKELINGKKFSETKLSLLLNILVDKVDEIALWYADYFDDIDEVYDVDIFFNGIETAVKEPTCEVYLHLINT